MKRNGAQAGFTVLELAVVMLIMMLTIAVAVPAFATMTGKDLKKASRQLSSVVRDTYDQAFLKNRPMRIVWNLDRSAFWVEVGTTEARIFRSEDEREEYRRLLAKNERLKEGLAEDREQERERRRGQVKNPLPDELTESMGEGQANPNALVDLFAGIFDASKSKAVHPADYKGVNGFTAVPGMKPFELPKGIFFVGARTYAYDDAVHPSDYPPETSEDEVLVSTTFFPSGYVEDTVIYLSDGDERVWSVLIDPLTGRVRVAGEMIDLPVYTERIVE